MRKGMRKEQNLIWCRPSRAETGLAGKKNVEVYKMEESEEEVKVLDLQKMQRSESCQEF